MPTQTNPTRVIDGTELPAAGTWDIDPGHTEAAFIGRHFLLTKVRGRFVGVTGAVTIGDQPGDSSVAVEIDMASVESGDQSRDDHLRSADFFDVEQWPAAQFRSTSVRWSGTSGQMTGDLTIRGVSRPVTLAVDYLGHVTDPWDNERAVFTATGRLDREEWGLTWNMPLANGGFIVSKQIDLELNIEAIRTS